MYGQKKKKKIQTIPVVSRAAWMVSKAKRLETAGAICTATVMESLRVVTTHRPRPAAQNANQLHGVTMLL